MTESPRNLTLQDYLRIARERRGTILLLTAVFAIASLVYTLTQPKVYVAEAAIQFRVENIDATVPVTLPGLNATERASVAARTVTAPAVAARARRTLATDIPTETLRAAVQAQTETGTVLVIVTARWNDPKFAARLADAFADGAVAHTQEEVRAIYKAAAKERRRLLTEQTAREVRIFFAAGLARLEQLSVTAQPAVVTSYASTPSAPVSPRPVRDVLLGLLLGLIVGVSVAFVRNALDRRFTNSRDIEDVFRLPILGFVPEEMLGRSVVSVDARRRLAPTDLDAAQVLLANVELLDVDNPPRMVLVTSAVAEEGKSTIAAAMACGYAAIGKSAILVECDLRRPELASRLGLNQSPGITDYLAGRTRLSDVIQEAHFTVGASDQGEGGERAVLSCIVAGSPVPQPVALLRSERARQFFQAITSSYDVILVDATPLQPVADTLPLISSTDAVVVCLRASKTTRAQAHAAVSVLERFPDVKAGIVVTGLRRREELAVDGYSAYVSRPATRRSS